jgi:hypothetical protein
MTMTQYSSTVRVHYWTTITVQGREGNGAFRRYKQFFTSWITSWKKNDVGVLTWCTVLGARSIRIGTVFGFIVQLSITAHTRPNACTSQSVILNKLSKHKQHKVIHIDSCRDMGRCVPRYFTAKVCITHKITHIRLWIQQCPLTVALSFHRHRKEIVL